MNPFSPFTPPPASEQWCAANEFDIRIGRLKGPILIIGASGFIGANLLRRCLNVRRDVTGTMFRAPGWRLEGIPDDNLAELDLVDHESVKKVLDQSRPRTIFDCAAYGSYPFESDSERIHLTNYVALVNLFAALERTEIAAYVHAGSSSEYGLNAAGPDEDSPRIPNSHYAVSKSAAAELISFVGRVKALPVVNLRLYSVYGPYEDSSRLIPTLALKGLARQLPPFVSPDTARDFIHVDDVVAAFIAAAESMGSRIAGQSFNIGTGRRLRIREVAEIAKRLFNIEDDAHFATLPARTWDLTDWYANPRRAEALLNWKAKIPFEDGLARLARWWNTEIEKRRPETMTKLG
jgi:dolichol-phosphate mannosyltransferase